MDGRRRDGNQEARRERKKRTTAGGESMSRRAERRVFDDKLAIRDVTFLYSALKPATESATNKAKFPRRKVDGIARPNFVTLSKEELFIHVRGTR